ncbi:hydrolase [Acinetobacter sp. 194]|uniref:hydrolase n=1 Tax=Acinetobacter shaoyimingii TaxID=2715164 RepID=UPI001408A862|nr:hydrolase [Acinetobacter shaoyimingii]NHB57530.1 hydrolase [Acinetobacter shaoyimingii]
MHSILLITGWGLGTKPLEALKQSLQAQGYQVELMNIFNAFDQVELDAKIKIAQKFDVIAGWSLGGQLASVLAEQIYKKTAKAKVLITLASNPCFIAKECWPIGMQYSAFQSFKSSFQQDALTTLKRFSYLVTQGSKNAKQDWQYLQNSVNDEDKTIKTQGLELLENLNSVSILESYQGPQYHVLAEDDGLVAYKVADYLRKIPAKFIKIDSVIGSHGFPLFNIHETTNKILGYLKTTLKK